MVVSMRRVILLMVIILQGCSAFPTGEMKEIKRQYAQAATFDHISMDAPVKVHFFSNSKSDDEMINEAAYRNIKKSVSSFYRDHGHDVQFVDEDVSIDGRYTDIYVVQDWREAPWEGSITGILSFASLGLVPVYSDDITQYVRISDIDKGNVISSNVYIRDMVLIGGTSLLPWAESHSPTNTGARLVVEGLSMHVKKKDI